MNVENKPQYSKETPDTLNLKDKYESVKRGIAKNKERIKEIDSEIDRDYLLFTHPLSEDKIDEMKRKGEKFVFIDEDKYEKRKTELEKERRQIFDKIKDLEEIRGELRGFLKERGAEIKPQESFLSFSDVEIDLNNPSRYIVFKITDSDGHEKIVLRGAGGFKGVAHMLIYEEEKKYAKNIGLEIKFLGGGFYSCDKENKKIKFFGRSSSMGGLKDRGNLNVVEELKEKIIEKYKDFEIEFEL